MKNNPALQLGFRYLLVLILFYVYTTLNESFIQRKQAFFCMGISAFIAFFGLCILYFKKNPDPQASTFRLLILITVQLLSFLSVSLALIYTNQPDTLALHLLALALLFIVVQTTFLVKKLKSSNEA